MLRSRALFLVFATVLPLAGAAYTSGCSTEDPSATPGLGNGDVGAGGAAPLDPCADPTHMGCPCADEGSTADCGIVKEKSGDFVLCSQGTSTCTEGKWGECKGEYQIIKSQGAVALTTGRGGVKPLDVSPPAGCVNNPCSPSCQVIGDNSNGVPVEDGGPIPTDGGGYTLEYHPIVAECSGLQCFQVQCPGNGNTTISGKVYDPSGLRPVSGALVMIPNGPVPPLPSGVNGTSDCSNSTLPKAISYAFTAADGSFTLSDVPVTTNLPVLIQIGRWRREITVNPVQCGNLPISAALTRLPKTQAEGNIPKIALRTAGCDAFECLLRRIGIADSEFTNPSGSGRVHLYRTGSGKRINSSTPDTGALLDNVNVTKGYDLVMLPCDCGSEYNTQSTARRTNLQTYANLGGRVFTSHWGREWVEHTSWSFVAQWYGGSCGAYGCADPVTGYIDTSFTRGLAFQQWMNAVGVSGSTFSISPSRFDVRKLLSTQAIRWVYAWSNNKPASHPGAPDAVADFTFDTPVNIPDSQKVGRVMYTDMHLADPSGGPGGTFPNGCNNPSGNISNQEKAAEYLLFDLGGCVGAEDPINTSGEYLPGTLTRDYSAVCPVGKQVKWRLFNWKASLPTPPMGVTGAYIHFDVQTADTPALLATATQISLADALVSNPTTWNGADVDVALKAANLMSLPHLRVTMQFQPSSDGKQPPTLLAWEQMFDCVDSE